jgi:hypothetical protein
MGQAKTIALVLAAGMFMGGAWGAFGAEKAETPKAVTNAVMKAHPDAKITSAKAEKEEIDQFEVEFTDHGKKMSADVTPDGTIIEIEEALEAADVPAAARAAIEKAADGGTVKEYEKATIMAKVDKEKNSATKLAEPMVQYEAGLSKDGKTAEVAVTAAGKVVEEPKWKKKGEKEDKEEKDAK